ncbi:hypothetical protein KIPB_013598, partial [Kipferlia bialata]|eukprot:g13598.t1
MDDIQENPKALRQQIFECLSTYRSSRSTVDCHIEQYLSNP